MDNKKVESDAISELKEASKKHQVGTRRFINFIKSEIFRSNIKKIHRGNDSQLKTLLKSWIRNKNQVHDPYQYFEARAARLPEINKIEDKPKVIPTIKSDKKNDHSRKQGF